MARGNNKSSRSSANLTRASFAKGPTEACDDRSMEERLQSIEHHWDTFKNQAAKKFLLGSSNRQLSLSSLIDFFSRDDQYGFAEMAVNVGTAHTLALEYLTIGAYSNAKNMALCGAFFKQCQSPDTPIDLMRTISIKDDRNPVELPHFFQGIKASRDQLATSAYIQRMLPMKYTKMLGLIHHTQNTPDINYCELVGRAFNNGDKPRRRQSSASDDHTEISVVFRSNDGSTKDEIVVVKRSDVMKDLFSQFAEASGVSLRSQRFSRRGSTLFLSSVGKKSLDQLGLQDNDVIEVTSLISEPTPSAQSVPSSPKKKAGGKKKTQRKNNGKRGKKQTGPKTGPKYVANSSEQDKLAHSLKLTRVIEEMEPRLKLIRQELNCSMLKRQSTKVKKLRPRSKSPDSVAFVPHPAHDGLGGKAGKTSYQINVGINENLYLTSKNQSRRRSSATIDLHGFTKSEATDKLDEVLPTLVDEAMRGSYPFVISANIVCGGGRQELSETVATWIKRTKNVANAPRNSVMPQ